MECRWDSALLRHFQELPESLIDAIKGVSDERYLTSLTLIALQPRYTYILFAHCREIFPHICADLRRHGSLAQSIATLGRVVAFAPNLSIYARRLLEREEYVFGTKQDSSDDLAYLLGLFRILRHDHETFRPLVDTNTVTGLLLNRNKSIVYLAIRILQICLDGADAWFEHMIGQHCGDDTSDLLLDGAWDDQTIDYRFLTLWEEERQRRVDRLLVSVRSSSETQSSSARTVVASSFHVATCLYGSILLPRYSLPDEKSRHNSVVKAPSTVENMHALASALQSAQPLLLTGMPGSGKTMLIRDVARESGKLDRMITLHLNEQSDAKALIGIYATGSEPGTFIWRPGVVTTAVQEGRWVVIEDLDRAPQDIIGALLPLIERRELTIPNRGHTLHAHHDFRLLATTRPNVNHRGDATKALSHMIGRRHWLDVDIMLPSDADLTLIANTLYPTLRPLLPQFVALFSRLSTLHQQKSLTARARTGILRPTSPRDFLKFCRRTSKLMQGRSTLNDSDFDAMYLEAMDCFCGALPESEVRTNISAAIAEELRINPQRRDFLEDRDARYENSKERLVIGRYTLPKEKPARQQHASHISFSTNAHTSRMLERVAAAVSNREPLLLVGETGVGKTTAVQHLAQQLGKRLVPFNLSQQTESGDLLGGFKPVNARSLMIPLHDDFSTLFAASFSATKNQDFVQLLSKAMTRGQWKVVCKLWRQALQMVDKQRSSSAARSDETARKRRKTDARQIDFQAWGVFADKALDIERRLEAGQENFAFSFVEGNIVKAVRNGDWVLLDEINLASSDTLDALADLLDSDAPSLLLTEAGDVESVKAHPAFRLFAAMNPATDVGKKDLPPGIRSRFTELYVESPDRDLKSLQSIVRSYLRDDAAGDESVAHDVSVLYQKITGMAIHNKLVDGAGQKPHFSLRTLTRTLSYARYIAPQCSLRRALYEGFQMSFLTFLDSESSNLVEPLLLQHLFAKKTNVRTELRKSLRSLQDGHSYLQAYPGSKHWVRQGILPIQEQTHYIVTPFIRDNLENLVRASSTRKFPVLIQGPTSSGKTSMIEYLAKRTGHHFVRINNHEHTDLQEYLGTYISTPDGRLEYQEGILVKALREGHWIVLDELNLAPTDVLEALNRLLDDNRELLIPETQEVVRPHESFMLFATQNPAGLYGGRKTLSRAFRNRFLELHFDDIPVNELQEILHKRTQLPESRCKRIVNVYRELSVLRQENRLFEQKSFATLRDLFRWALRPNDTIEQLAANGYMLLAERVRKAEERDAIKNIIEKAMSSAGPKVSINEAALYGENAPEIATHTHQAQHHGVVWTKAMRRLYTLVARAIQNDEPVLLVGETGCGKTTVCQMLADALRQPLATVNAHQNTETGDLIGSQRPVRNRAANEAQLRSLLLASEVLRHMDSAAAQSTDDLLGLYDNALAALANEAQAIYQKSQPHHDVQLARTRYKALFEWVDGTLVDAMRNGSFFLLDEISLADDSVLERINSVLESSRAILLAEKGVTDSFVTATPGFQFFATMNPGGDYGKRELSPALRNRFTEIWVPALSDLDDVVQIVQAKLSPHMSTYATAMVDFARWFNERYNTSTTSAVSIRDVLAWTSFANLATSADPGAAVLNGAAMVYIDTLGANPAGLMTAISSDLDAERRDCIGTLSDLLHNPQAATMYYAPIEVTINQSRARFGSFALPRADLTNTPSSSFSFDTPTARVNAMRVVRAMQLTKPILLEGSPGVGKTALVTAIASTAGVPLTRINLSEQTDLMDLFGSDVPVQDSEVGTFVWQDAPFLRAMKHGEWVLLDEMNLASQSVLEGLNACLDHRGEVFVPEIGQTFTRHSDFRLFAAQNPHHQGGGRKGLPASFVNRFTVVYADALKSEDLMMICQRSYPVLGETVIARAVDYVSRLDAAVSRQKRFGSQGGPWEFNLRDITRWLSLVGQNDGLLAAGNARDFVEMLFAQRFRNVGDREQAMKIFQSVYGNELPRTDLVSSVSPSALQLGLGLLRRHTVHAPLSNRSNQVVSNQLYSLQSMMIAVHQSWPVILSGPSGVGKTTMVEGLAASVGASIETFTMNAETDVMDLIGGYEQADSQREIATLLEAFFRDLQNLVKTSLTAGTDSQHVTLASELRRAISDASHVPTLLQLLDQCDVPGADLLAETIRASADAVDKARFVWIDGFLVDAVLHGRWLVLDNANLCSPSVLDRLNSLLEPNGVLIMSEHVGDNGAPRIVRPHANFRIFLTVDPRYGDLSRAMRNRALEIHLLEPTADQPLLAPLNTESAIARFRKLQATWPAAGSVPGSLELGLEQLAICDQPHREAFTQQAGSGLAIGALLETQQLVPRRHSLRSMGQTNGLDQLEAFYQSAVGQKQVPADFASVQSVHPLTNQPLVQSERKIYLTALCMGFSYELRTDLETLRQVFEAFQADRNIVAALVRAEKQQHIAGSKGASNVLRTLVRFIEQVHTACHNIRVDEAQLAGSRRYWQYMIATLRRICELCGTQTVNSAVLSACLGICYQALTLAPDMSLVHPSLKITGQALSAIVPTQTSLVGTECVAMWEALRPKTPVTEAHLRSLVRLEDLIKQIDTLALRFQQPLDAIVALRQSCSRALDGARMSGADVDALAARLSNFEGLPDDVADAESSEPCLVSIFDVLSRHLSALKVGGLILDTIETATVDALALRPVVVFGAAAESVIPGQEALARLPAVVHYGQAMQVGITPRSLADTALHGLRSVDNVSLKNLQLLQSEVQVLGQVAAGQAHLLLTEQQPKLDSGLRDIVHAVLSALQRSDRADVRSIAIGLATAAGGSEVGVNVHQEHENLPWTMHMARAVEYLSSQHSAADTRYARSAGAWRAVALACFYLYLPDVSFDPALEPLEKHAIHKRNELDLGRRLEALRNFGHKMTGVESSLRVRLLDSDLQAIGPAPELPPVFRPASSELASLQMEFDGLWRVIKTIEASNTSSLDSGIRANLTQIRRRLADQYRAYDDFTTPVLGFIDCLFVGDHLVEQGLIVSASSRHVQIGQLIPFAAGSLATWQSEEALVAAQSNCATTDERIIWLSAIGARSAVWPLADAPNALVHAVEIQFAQLYDQWRTELNRDQINDVAKSSLYRYVDNAELEEDPTDDQLDEFLHGARDTDVRNTSDGRPPAIRKRAGTIVAVHRALCTGGKSESDIMLDLLRQHLQAMPHDGKGHRLIASLPMLMLRLQDAASSCKEHSAAGRPYNMYADANPVEVQRLEKLIRVVQSRFGTLRIAWPDHATPVDVLVLCDQVVFRAHSDPLPDFIPLLEKLHATINEWQKIASREYSAAAQYESITDLIIDWRRLELSSWAGMFGQEIRRSKDEAAAWWFVAYETIIAATETLPEDDISIHHHVVGMLGALDSFMHTSGLGEYQVRLDLLRDFEAHALLRARQSVAFHKVHEGLANVVAYFIHFEDAVQQALVTGRATLEKSLREMIKIASWKDRNINTLRQSAKASHRKLFRLVRKFRVLLAQPVTHILQAGIPDVKGSTEYTVLESSVEITALTAIQDSKLCLIIPGWASRAPRFRNMDTTVSLMQSKALAQVDLHNSALRLDAFLDNLATSIKALQQETPLRLTAENKVMVNHLKTRKRRLLADVLKNARSMGLQHNLGEDLLSKLSSFSSVMAQLHVRINPKATPRAMYQFLGTMHPAREAARKHSEDLTPAETARCVAYLESLLSVTIRQHNMLAEKRAVSEVLAMQLRDLRGFAQCTNPILAGPTQSEWDVQSVACVAQVLSAAAKLVEIQAQLSGKDFQPLVIYLTDKVSAMNEHVQQWRDTATLPAGIVDGHDAERSSTVSGILKDVLSHMSENEVRHPELGYLIQHLEEWLARPGARSNEYTNGVRHQDKDQWLQDLLSCLDTVLAAVQRVEGVFAASATNVNEASWLLEHQRLHESAWDALAYAEVSQKIASLVTNIRNVSSGQGNALNALALTCQALYPMLDTYVGIGERLLSALSSLHTRSGRLGHVLAKSFITLAKDGFCSPPEKSQEGKQESGDVETGTGLGEGEGGEDISKDVGADEDLSELAQEKNKADKDGDVEDEKDAVDMADQEMEGELGDVEAESSDGEDADDDGEKDLDEEAGSVGDLDDGAVDEKMWDEGKAEQENSKEADSGNTTAKDQDLSAAAEGSKEEAKDGDAGEEGEEEEESADAGAEDVTRQETEAVDPHMPEQGNLDLPDDIDMEDASDSDGMSDVASVHDDDLPEADGEETMELPDTDHPAESEDVQDSNDPEDEAERTAEAGDDAEPDIDADEDDTDMLQAINEQQDQPADAEVAGEQGTGMETDPSQAHTEGGVSEQDQQPDTDTSASTQQASGAQSGAEADKQATDSPQAASQSRMEKQRAQYQELGNVLDEWYRQQREIQAPDPEADGSKEAPETEADVDMADTTFEHLLNEGAEADTQALGTASADQSGALNEETSRAVKEQETQDDVPFQDMPDDPEHEIEDVESGIDDKTETNGQVNEPRNAKAMVGDKSAHEDVEMEDHAEESEMEDVDDVDDQLLHTHISSEASAATMSLDEARSAWAEHESSTRNLALILTEHLRLILHPTQATKMRGDFRTGKRLNIKRIIPYIASSYKRDKIWMRRSIPSKRSYQIMLAIDDSKSMDESDSKSLAFETLALVAKSMSMLEVGEICVLGFGEEVKLAHDFSTPFTSEAGAEVFQSFTFAQSKTNVRKMLAESIELFRAARLKATGSSSELWQLQLIISDGVCEDHPSIRQLVRQAFEERIMVVFVIVDALSRKASTPTQSAAVPNQSILDLQTAEFAKDADGEMQLKMVKYLDTFPFQYYLIVRDVQELPGVLAGALRQWFAEVVESGGD
ncbi:hypothetical protein B0A48_05306 [Cryoendolithus antarcticus]|uniref:Midasin n=1 Tax=Cryoendolithus antarcticus TaxID=1507870 RepID=A0A1V8TIH5_9PEZI|nr:hypothetical protein B0A48_05306 [Cryoendolithus antarcticus]